MNPSIRETNLSRWNELAPLHARSAFYDVPAFKAGKTSLKAIEIEEVGDVAGKSLLHLQCHFGLDTLSWARRGARVTGVDFSDEAIALARSLSGELGIESTFLCTDVYELPSVLSGRFDIVFTSYGALCWLPDLVAWARVIARYVKPNGVFYMVEIHPFGNVFDDRPEATGLQVGYSYFERGSLREESNGSYADRQARVVNRASYVWHHPMGDILNELIAAGLTVEFVHEFPYGVCATLPYMEQGADGWWRIPGQEKIPLLFSVKARNSKL